MIRIKIEGKNIADLWNLACVTTIAKTPEGNIFVAVKHTNEKGKTCSYYGIIGDTIETENEQSESGKIIMLADDIRTGLVQ